MKINSSSTKSWIVALTHLHVFFVWLFVTPSVYFSISNFASVFLHILEQTDIFSVSCLSPLVSFSSFGKLCYLTILSLFQTNFQRRQKNCDYVSLLQAPRGDSWCFTYKNTCCWTELNLLHNIFSSSLQLSCCTFGDIKYFVFSLHDCC